MKILFSISPLEGYRMDAAVKLRLLWTAEGWDGGRVGGGCGTMGTVAGARIGGALLTRGGRVLAVRRVSRLSQREGVEGRLACRVLVLPLALFGRLLCPVGKVVRALWPCIRCRFVLDSPYLLCC